MVVRTGLVHWGSREPVSISQTSDPLDNPKKFGQL